MNIDIALEVQHARFLKCIGEPTRLSIMRMLCEGERSVAEICQAVERDQPLVSHHLRALRECGIVATRQQAQKVYYRLADPMLGQLLILSESVVNRLSPCGPGSVCCEGEETAQAAPVGMIGE